MLTGDQINYLLQIEDTKPPLPERTVRVMLGVLRWSPEEIDHGINFLRRPPVAEKPKPVEPVQETQKPASVVTEPPRPVIIKQNPFPIGSPLLKNTKHRSEFLGEKKNHFLRGAIIGGIVFLVGLFAYAYLSEIGK